LKIKLAYIKVTHKIFYVYTNIPFQVKALWSKKACEIVVAIILSKDKKMSYILHHSELKTLQPHKWLMGEVRKNYSYLWEMLCN